MVITLALQQDYLWFLALLAWGVAFAWWAGRFRARAAWRWLPWTALAGMAVAVVELAASSLPVQARPWVAPYGHWEIAHAVALTLMIAGCYAEAWRGARLRGSLALVAIVLTLLTGLFRWQVPVAGAWLLAVVGTAACLVHFRAAPNRAAGFALAAALAVLWLDNSGPLAESLLTPRRWAGLDAWCLVHAGVLLGAAGVVLWALQSARQPAAPGPGEPGRKVLFLCCAAWLVVGLWLAGLMGGFARRSFETSALGRAGLSAALFDPAQLADLLSPEFRLDSIIKDPRPDGSVTLHGVVNRMETPAGWQVARQLARIELANPDVLFASLGTLRDGWLVLVGSNQQPGPASGVGLARQHDPTDLQDWRRPVARYLRPHATELGLQTEARSPVLGPKQEMLGWLVLLFPLEAWNASQAQARLLVFVIIAFGLGLAALLDLQRRRGREREAARSEAAAALQADRLKTAFLAKVSHELRTPIQSILGYGELLRTSVGDPVARSRLQALRQHTDLMLRLVNDLLDLSAIQMGAFRLREQPVQLRELVRQTAESLRPRAEAKGVAFSVRLEPGVPEWARVDGERVRQIVLNLVSNAVKFTDQGRVEVTLGREPATPAVRLTVRDTGPGIPDAQRASLFQPFSRLEATIAKEGTGLGLSLAAALCRSMQGQILLDDQAEGGAAFSATFAAPACAAPGPVLPAESDLAATLRGLRVLIADDNSLVRDLFASYLREAGAHCTAVGDGEQALAALGRESYDCLVLDLAMPRLDGWETARRLHLHRPAGLRLVGVSAHADEADRGRAAALGFDAFLVKPVELNTLAGALGANRPLPPRSESTAELVARLRQQFRHEAAVQQAAVQVALREENFAAVEAAAHYLCNSAAVVRDDLLHAASARLETAAQAGDPAALAAAWRGCEQALVPWLEAGPIPSGSTPVIR